MKKIIIMIVMIVTLQAEVIELKPITVTGDGSRTTNYSNLGPLEQVESETVLQETVPGFKQPIIHGLMGDKVLLTVDGIKFSNSLFRSGPNQYYSWIPDDFVVKAELNSNLSGITSSALGGSIDRTIGIDSSSVSITTDLSDHKEVVKYQDGKTMVGVINDKRQNVVTPTETVQHSAYNQKGFLLGYKTKDYGETKLLFTRSDDIDRTDKFQQGDYYVYTLQQYLLLSNKYHIPDTDFIILPSFQQFREKIDRHSPLKKDIDSTNNMFGLQALGYYEPSWTDDGYFSYGLVDNFEDIGYTKGIIKNNYGYNTFSAYATFHSGYKKLDYDLKYKYSVMTARGSGLDRILDNHSLGIDTKYRLGFLQSIFVNADMNYKFPTITNLAAARDDSVTEIANPDLEQEKAYTLTLGYNYDAFTTSIFYKKLSNMIIREQTNIPDGNGGYKWKYQNTDNGFIKGLDLKYDKKFENGFGLYGFLEYLDGKTDYDYISKLTPLHTKAKVSYKPYYLEWLYAPSVSESKMALKDKTDYRIKDHNYGYNIINIGYAKTFKKVHSIEVSLDNVFNRTGRVYGSSVDFGARSISLLYKYSY